MRDQNDMILRMDGICKAFSGVKALDGVNLHVRRGTVHALMGENGAGKSTLMKILFGIYVRDAGTIEFDGKEYQDMSAALAHQVGISMIHQELMSIPDMSVADNIYVSRYEDASLGLVNRRKTEKRTQELLDNLGIQGFRPGDHLRNLSAAQRQMVEIVKAVSTNSKLIIMDEPTSSLSDVEIKILFRIIRTLRDRGISIIYISHKLDEIFEITDEYTVFRDGTYICEGKTSEITESELIAKMVGRSLENLYYKTEVEIGEEVLRVEGLSSGKAFHDVSFNLHKGEILGVSGLVGAGRTEMVETIMGLRKATAGKVYKDGQEIRIRSVRDGIKYGIALATEDRKKYGLVLGLPISFNISISSILRFCRFGLVKGKQEREEAKVYADKMKVKMNSVRQPVGSLSGGNQQKVVLAKWLMTDADIIILDEPTRGIDVGAKAEIYRLMEELASNGKAIIMVSSESLEILGMSDRILVMREGEMMGIYDRAEADAAKIVGY